MTTYDTQTLMTKLKESKDNPLIIGHIMGIVVNVISMVESVCIMFVSIVYMCVYL